MKRWRISGLLVLLWSGLASAASTITMTPNPLDAGNVSIGSSGNATGTLADSAHLATVDLVLTSTCSGTGTGAFAFVGSFQNLDLTGSGQMVTIQYTPATRGARSCTVNVNDHTLGTLITTFTASGTGIAPVIAVAPATKDYGNVRWNDAAATHTAAQAFTISNSGTGDLVVSSIMFSGAQPGDYAVTSGTFPTTIAPGNNSAWTVTFNPAVAGASSATMTIASNDPVTPNKTVSLQGTGTNAVIAVTDVAFGTVTQGGGGTAGNISITNTGAAPQGPLGVTLGTFGNNAAGWFSFNTGVCAGSKTTCALALSVGASPATVAVKCAPPANASGTQTATVTFTSDTDDATDNTSMLTCTAGRADVAVDTMSLVFGNQKITTTSSPQLVMISNVGNQTLDYSVGIVGANPGQFAITSGCTTACTLGAGMSVSLGIAFAPTTVGAKSAIVRITPTNDPDTANLDVMVTGTGVAPHATQNPLSISFGNVELGKTSSTMTLAVQNTGTSDLTVSNAGFTSGGGIYATTSGTTGPQTTTVVAGGMTSWTIDCTPAAQGANAGNFRVTSDSDAIPNSTLDVALSCTGQIGVLAIAPTSFNFGGVRIGDPPATHTFTLSNTGNVAVTGITAVLSNMTVGYSITSPTFPISLNPGASQPVVIQFLPAQPTDGGMVTATFAGVWGSTNTPTSAATSINGAALVPGYDTNPHMFSFPDERFDQSETTTIDITDTGTSPVQLMSIALDISPPNTAMSGDFTIVSVVHGGTTITTAPYTVQLTGQNDHATVTVRAGPLNRVANSTATLHVHSDLGGPTPDRDVPLSVNGTTAVLSLTPAMVLDFGAVDLDAGPVTQTITVLNTGQATLNTGLAPYVGSTTFKLTPSPVPAQAVAPGSSFTISVTYTPTTAMPPNNFDQGTLTIPLTGIAGGPPSAQMTIRGRGITRNMVLGAAPTFPDTFRNPGDKAPVMPVHVQNTGEATLSISGVMIAGDPVWTLVNPDPVDIPGNSAYDFMVRFAPTMAGKAPDGTLMLVDNDTKMPTATIMLSGTGLDRDVDMGPPTIDLGYTGVGIPVRLSQIAPNGLLDVMSMDGTNTFTIRAITIDGDGSFTVTDLQGNPVSNVPLSPMGSQQFDIVFDPKAEGDYNVHATLFLDQDPVSERQVPVVAHALFVDAHGGGGCSTGRGSGAGMLLVIGALVLARRRRGLAVLLVAFGATASRAAPPESPQNLDLGVFQPAPETTPSNVQVETATVGADGDWALLALTSYANNPLVLSTSQNDDAQVKNRIMFLLGGSYAFLDRFEAGLHMPLYVQNGDAINSMMMFGEPAASGAARGDLVLHAKAQLWRGEAVGGTFASALAGGLTLPTATDNEFAGLAKPSGRILALASLTPGLAAKRLTINLDVGGVIRGKTTFANITLGSGFAWGIGGAYRVIDPMFLTAEAFGEVVPSGRANAMGTKSALSTAEWLVGIRYQLERRSSLGLAVGRGLVAGFGAPDLRGVLEVTFTPGAVDLPPLRGTEGDYSDRDGDGIPDSRDKCPDDPEDKDMFQDEDGCPDPDNDGDGIPDAQDKCPLDPEDKDGFQDADGCPDKDNDNDGIPDAQDKCPNEPEDKDGFQDLDGCPDPDNDADGIPDTKDKCPNDPETINGFQDDDGCPDKGDSLVMMSPDRLDTLESIQFNGQKLAKQSFNVLGQVAATLRAHTEVVRVRITVHVQPSGNPDRDQELSVKRALAVRDWLVQWGINTARLDVRGFGGTKPLVPPTQRGAQSINDRVELVILERK